MEPDTVSTPKINRNTFKIGSGDLQQQVANNTKRIRVISTMLKGNRRRGAEGLSPQATNIQQSLEQSNLILADIAIQLEADFTDRKNKEKLLLLRNREEKLELRRRNLEEGIEYKKTEKKITKSTNKIKGPLQGIFKTIGKILLLFGGLVLIKTLLGAGNVERIVNSEAFQNAKTALEATFSFLTKNMKGILVLAGVFLGLKLAATLGAILSVGAGVISILANPLFIAGVTLLLAAGMQGLGGNEKDVIKQLEEMGGFSKENRDALAEKYRKELAAMPFLERKIKEGEYKSRIKFLETGDYSSGGNKKVFDWSQVDSLDKFTNFEKLKLSINDDLVKSDDSLKKNNNNDKITTINIEGETVDLRGDSKKGTLETSNNQSATETPYIASVDSKNYKIKEFAETAGFYDSVYG